MKKGIILVDIPDDVNTENLFIRGIMYEQLEKNEMIIKSISPCSIGLLPQKREPSSCITPSITYAQGWNDCLWEITGEE